MNLKKDCKGFTLLELIIVMAIMAILTGIVASSVIHYVEKARMAKVRDQAALLQEEFLHSLAWANSDDETADVRGESEWVYSGHSEGAAVNERVGTLTNFTMHRIQSGMKLPLDTTTNRAGQFLCQVLGYKATFAVTDSIQGMTFEQFYNGISEHGKYAGLVIVYNGSGDPFRLLYSNNGYFVDINDGEAKVYTPSQAIKEGCTFKVTSYVGEKS